MEFTIIITGEQLYALCLFIFVAVLFYIYTKIDGDDRLTHLRHDVEMKKEWFRMLAEQKKLQQNKK
jgi:uncharacterized membrane protein